MERVKIKQFLFGSNWKSNNYFKFMNSFLNEVLNIENFDPSLIEVNLAKKN